MQITYVWADSFGPSLCSQLLTGLRPLVADLKMEEGEREGTGVQRLAASTQLPEEDRGCLHTSPGASTSRWGLWISPPLLSDFPRHRRKRISHFLYFDLYQWHGSRTDWSWMETNPIWESFQIGKQLKQREVPLLNWPPGDAFSWFDELNFRRVLYFIGIPKQGTICEEQFIYSMN